MFQIPCPHCGPRNAAEFRHSGEGGGARPDPQATTPEEWRRYLYEKRNVAGWTAESWYHGFGCRKFIAVQRHTVTNEVRPAPATAPTTSPPGPSADSGAPDADSTPS